MTQITPRLERAIKAGELARFKKKCEEPNYKGITPYQAHAQALIADLLLEEPAHAERSGKTYNAGFDNGYALAVYHMRKRAGLVEDRDDANQ